MTNQDLSSEPEWPGLSFALFNNTLSAKMIWSKEFGHDEAMVWILELLLQPQIHGIPVKYGASISCLCQRFFFASFTLDFLQSLEAEDTVKKVQLIRATLPHNVHEVQANAQNMLPKTRHAGGSSLSLAIEPVMVPFPHNMKKELGIVDYGTALGYIFLVLELLDKISKCNDAQMLMRIYYLPSLAVVVLSTREQTTSDQRGTVPPTKAVSDFECLWNPGPHRPYPAATLPPPHPPCSAARERGVRPSLSLESGPTPSLASGSFTTTSFPYSTVHENGIRPFVSLESGSTPSLARSNFTTASHPAAVQDGGVRAVLLSLEFGQIPSLASSSFTSFVVVSDCREKDDHFQRFDFCERLGS